jgi:hypothetical protein
MNNHFFESFHGSSFPTLLSFLNSQKRNLEPHLWLIATFSATQRLEFLNNVLAVNGLFFKANTINDKVVLTPEILVWFEFITVNKLNININLRTYSFTLDPFNVKEFIFPANIVFDVVNQLKFARVHLITDDRQKGLDNFSHFMRQTLQVQVNQFYCMTSAVPDLLKILS